MGMVRVCLQGQSKSHLIFAGKETKTNNNNNNHDTSFNHILARSEGDVCHSVASDHIVAKHVWTVNTEHELRPWEMTGCLICIAESQMETTAAEATAVGRSVGRSAVTGAVISHPDGLVLLNVASSGKFHTSL